MHGAGAAQAAGPRQPQPADGHAGAPDIAGLDRELLRGYQRHLARTGRFICIGSRTRVLLTSCGVFRNFPGTCHTPARISDAGTGSASARAEELPASGKQKR